MSWVEGVIFDIDGTLVDSNDAHAHAWVEALAEFGHKISFEKVRPLIGMGSDKLLPAVIKLNKDTEEGESISKRRSEIFKEKYLPDLQPCAGAHELLQKMRDEGLKMVVATSAQPEEVQALLAVAQANDFFHSETSSDEVENTKPDPDVIELALEKLNIPRSKVMMIGDTPYDVEAAAKAEVATVAVKSGGWQENDLQNAMAIYNDPADLLHNYDASPFGHSA
jgi:HAD superfamily hydrolase (TIGR01549 family)